MTFFSSKYSLGIASIMVAACLGFASPAWARQFPKGTVSRVEDLPVSRFRKQLEKLPAPAKARAIARLHNFHFTEQDLNTLHADAEGGIFYIDSFQLAPAPALARSEPVIAEAALPVNPFPPSLIFHSRPGAPNVLYINFTGESVSNTAWNTYINRAVIPAVAFSTDGDYSTFSDAEQLAIKSIWQRMSEDYAPFNIDVTTERPASFGIYTAHALITRSTDANGEPNPAPGSGGVAYIDEFGYTGYASHRPAWIYINNLGYDESYIAEGASHEVGHNLGLSHDGRTDGSEYYQGHGGDDISWGTLMGLGYARNVSQWCKGDYYLANNTQDDLAIIATKLTYRADDHGDTFDTATALTITDGANIVSTTPENDPANTNRVNKGVIQMNTDVDMFSFATGNGAIDLSINPWITPSGLTHGGNLDLLVELYDRWGQLLLADNPPDQTYARIQTNLTEGLYYLLVRNTGAGNPFSSNPRGYTSYGSIGQYFISGTIAPTPYNIPVPIYTANMDTSPGWTLEPLWQYGRPAYTGIGPTNGFTGTNIIAYNLSGNYENSLATKYATTPPINAAVAGSLTLHFHRWLRLKSGDTALIQVSTNGVAWTNIWTTSQAISDTSWQDVSYALPSWVAGSSIVRLRWGISSGPSQNDIGWNIDDIEIIARSFDSLPPTALLNVMNITNGGSVSHLFTVTYADSNAVRVSTITSSNLVVTGPNGYTNIATLVSVDNSTDGTPRIAFYSLPAPGGSWDYTDNGNYVVTLRGGQVSDIYNNFIGGTNLGSFAVSIPAPVPANFSFSATVNNTNWGSVNPASGTYAKGSAIQVTATPSSYYRFDRWTGDITATNNPLNLILNTNLVVVALFAELLTTNHPTPLWWLASYGYTANFETAVDIVGTNGIPLWQSYIAGLNPNDPSSQLRLALTTDTSRTNWILRWNPVADRLYTLYSTTNFFEPFSIVPGASNLPSSITLFTNYLNPPPAYFFYKLGVQKP